jgi:hypothetical protein
LPENQYKEFYKFLFIQVMQNVMNLVILLIVRLIALCEVNDYRVKVALADGTVPFSGDCIVDMMVGGVMVVCVDVARDEAVEAANNKKRQCVGERKEDEVETLSLLYTAHGTVKVGRRGVRRVFLASSCSANTHANSASIAHFQAGKCLQLIQCQHRHVGAQRYQPYAANGSERHATCDLRRHLAPAYHENITNGRDNDECVDNDIAGNVEYVVRHLTHGVTKHPASCREVIRDERDAQPEESKIGKSEVKQEEVDRRAHLLLAQDYSRHCHVTHRPYISTPHQDANFLLTND